MPSNMIRAYALWIMGISPHIITKLTGIVDILGTVKKVLDIRQSNEGYNQDVGNYVTDVINMGLEKADAKHGQT